MDILFVTGLSGAGKSTSLAALEDIEYYCVDNVPVPLVAQLAGLVVEADRDRRLALGVDSRELGYATRLPAVHAELVAAGHRVQLLFLDAADAVLVRRFAETRRKHPLGELPHAIRRERELLAPIRQLASVSVDTSSLTGRELRQLVRDRFGASPGLRVALLSFGFREGVPSEADVVFDVRFLQNPFEQAELRPMTGLHEPVASFVLGQPDAVVMLERMEELVRFMAPRVVREGRSYLTVAIGCTGGQHRSVALVEALEARLAGGEGMGKLPATVTVRHREIGRAGR